MTNSRVDMPTGFFDKTSDMLLREPRPQYLYAQLFLNALRASLETPGEMGLPFRPVGGVGAPYSAADRDALMLSDPIASGTFGATFAFDGEKGDTIRINRPSFATTNYTEANRRIAAGDSISTSPIKIDESQTSLTLMRYAGPYDTDNSRVAPYAIDAFNARMGVHNAAKRVGTHLKDDFHHFIDAVQVQLLDLASAVDRPAQMTADDDATAAGQFPMTYELLSRVEEEMDTANLPTFPDGFRLYVGSPKQINQLRADKQYRESAKEFPQYNILFPEYVGSINKFHIFRSTTLTASNNSSSVPIHRGHALAPGALLAGMGRPPRVQSSTDDNYGEEQKVIWRADLAFGLADNRFVRSVRTSA